ncbi:MAG: glycerol dehydrogenase [Bifidobacteriaceae bacterium]|jgi:glycerol dehydrogenase|nr:glycerol dehydrogenase [Bifidobacteriaceae bacterium]
MKKAILLPRKYVQGRGVVSEVGAYVASLGQKAVIVWGPKARAASADKVLASLAEAGVAAVEAGFKGESTHAEAERVAEAVRQSGAEVVLGVGGGKVIDTAKAAAIATKAGQVIVPTIASNDAPTSACTVWYSDDGVMVGFDLWPANPDYIIVDTDIIAKAPPRWFRSGLGDAFATWFEADVNRVSHAPTCSGGVTTLTAQAMARLCYETIREYGLQALADVGAHVATQAVEKVVEATTLLSGVGWESGGLATAHAVGNGLPAIPETHPYTHGEKVSFGIVTQLCIDDSVDPDLREDTVAFLARAGLPVTFEEVGIAGIGEERLRAFGAQIAGPGSFVHNHPFEVSAQDAYDALVSADAIGQRIKAKVAP